MNKLLSAFLCVVFLFFSMMVFAQENASLPDVAGDPEMAVAVSGAEPFSLTFGGWITPTYLTETATSGDKTSLMTLPAKIWGKLTLSTNSFIYIRGKDTYTKTIKPSADTENVWDFDLGYIELASARKGVVFDAGRKFFTVGSGLVLAGRGDGADLEIRTSIVDLRAFGMYTGVLKKSENPYDFMNSDQNNGAKRIFTGGVIEKRLFNQKLYAFGVAQIDRSDEGSLKERYQSQYYGAGINGIPVDGLTYSLEGIYETGKSYRTTLLTDAEKAAGETEKPRKTAKIGAYAAVFSLDYFIDTIMKPSLAFQYGYASGDKDRRDATSATGNVESSDSGFIAFGAYNSGAALRPALSNLHVIRGGFSFQPLESLSSSLINRVLVSMRYNYYMKDKAKAPINGEAAPKNNKAVGQGFDCSLKWKIFADLSFQGQYGIFMPGSAYDSSAENSQSVLAGMMLEF